MAGREENRRREDSYQTRVASVSSSQSKDRRRMKNSVWQRDSVSFSICLMGHSGNRLKGVTERECVATDGALVSLCHCDESKSPTVRHYRRLPHPQGTPDPLPVSSPTKSTEHKPSALCRTDIPEKGEAVLEARLICRAADKTHSAGTAINKYEHIKNSKA